MTYLGVNPERLTWLLRKGITEEELKRFFKERQKMLIMKREKLQNLPRNFNEALMHLVRFSDAAQAIFGDWLRHQESEELAHYQTNLLSYFRSMDSYSLELPDDETHKLARSGLLELYSVSPPADWIDFLRTETSPQKDALEETSEVNVELDAGATLTPEVAIAYAEWAVGVRSATDIPDRTLRDAAILAEAARSGDRTALAGLTIEDEAWNEISRVHSEVARRSSTSIRQGFIAKAPPLIVRDVDVDYLSLDVVCTPSRNVGTGPFFLDVLCFIGNSGAFSLSEDDLRNVVPDEGRVILHADAGLPVPIPGVAEAYRVEFFKTPRSIKVRVIDFGDKLFRVMYVPYASDQKDAIREWLRDRAQGFQGKMIVFVLADGLCIRPRGEGSSNLSAPGFTWTFDSWQSLIGMELTQAAYVSGPLPDPDAIYECPPVSVVARRFLKSLVDRKQTGLTKKQISDLSGLLNVADVSLTEESRRRISDSLATLASTDEFYEELVSEVMKSSAVQRDIELRKQQAVAELDDNLAKKRNSLEMLRKDIQIQDDRLTKLKEQTEGRIKDIRTSIRKAFDQAKEHEAEVLGQLALWQELLAPARKEHGSIEKIADSPGIAGQRLSVTHLLPGKERLTDILGSVGMTHEVANLYSTALSVARDLGLPVVLTGAGAQYLGARIGSTLAERKVCVVDIGVGLIDARVLDPVLVDDECDVVVLRTANLSDVGVYAPRLIDNIAETLCRPLASRSTRMFLLLEASGPAALPWPAEIDLLSFKIELSSNGEIPPIEADLWLRSLPSPLQRKLWSRIEHAAEVQSVEGNALGLMRSMLWRAPGAASGG